MMRFPSGFRRKVPATGEAVEEEDAHERERHVIPLLMWKPVMVLAGVLLVAASGCGSDDTVDSGGPLVSDEGRIAFTRATSFVAPNFESDVYAIDVDGSDEERLTDSPGLDGLPAWFPNGESLAFTTDRDGNWEIYVMNADGSRQQRLTNTQDQEEGMPAISPDGEKIAFVTDPIGDSPAIWVMNADGSGRRRLVDGSWPGWSPDGQRIIYSVYSGNGSGSLLVMDADGSDTRRLGGSLFERITGRANGEEAAWSPDGERLAFASNHGPGNAEIYAVEADGTGRTRLTDIPGNDHWPPTWSPDGDRIAFTSDGTEGPSEIYVMNADGSGLTKLTGDPTDDAFPAWRP